MTKRIFRAICTVVFTAVLASFLLTMWVLYNDLNKVQKNQLKTLTEFTCRVANNEGTEFLDKLDYGDYRLTLISPEGDVLFDSEVDKNATENHLNRSEIEESLAVGYGESSRYSESLMQHRMYSAMVLDDGNVLRLSIAQSFVWDLLLDTAVPVLIIFVLALAAAFFLAVGLSKKVVEPLNELDLDKPMSNLEYSELSGLLRRIDAQQKQLKYQSAELEQRQDEFNTVTGSMNEGLILLNNKGTILSINHAAATLLDADSSCIGQGILTVSRNLDLQIVLRRALDGEQCEKIVQLHDGSYQLDASPVISDGLITGAVLLMFDVTEKERTEQIRREFTANVSHELKTPLHTISGYAELLSGGMVKTDDVIPFSGRIYTEAKRMIQLIEDIINLSHLDEGADYMKREELDLYSICCDVTASLSETADRAQVTFDIKGSRAKIYGIPRLIHEIIYNLCDNAIKYNKQGGSVTVAITNSKEKVILSVVDTGIGIPSEHQERIFERFYRVDKSHSKEVGGTGLGLSIVKHAAKIHKAEITLKSTAGQGTEIAVAFPK